MIVYMIRNKDLTSSDKASDKIQNEKDQLFVKEYVRVKIQSYL